MGGAEACAERQLLMPIGGAFVLASPSLASASTRNGRVLAAYFPL